jgi:hypothetical protein
MGWTFIGAGIAAMLLCLLQALMTGVMPGGPVPIVGLAAIIAGWFLVDS